MNIFRKLFEKFKKKEEVKKEDEAWFNQTAQKGEVLVDPKSDESLEKNKTMISFNMR